jgi:PDZ domain-containing secreted protein
MGGIQPKLLAAIEAGVKTVILPAENEQDVRPLPLPGPFAEEAQRLPHPHPARTPGA